MTTTTSFSKKDRFIGLYQSIFRRNIGYLGMISTLVAIFYPFQYALEVFNSHRFLPAVPTLNPFSSYNIGGAGQNFTVVSSVLFTAIMLITPLILALVLNGYMHSKKATDVYHALPIERGLLLGVHTAVSMSYIAIPVVLSNLVIAVIQVVKFGFYPALLGYMLLDMVCWLIAAFCIYTITVFVSVLVGTIFDAFAFSCTLLASVLGLWGLFSAMASMYLLGFQVNEDFITKFMNLSPVTAAPYRFILTPDYLFQVGAQKTASYKEFLRLFNQSNLAMLIWLVLGCVLLFVSMKLYHKRGSELAETTTSKGILPITIKFLTVLFSGCFSGIVFQEIVYESSYTTFFIWSIIGGILAYAIVEVILNRGFKTLIKSLPLGFAMMAVTVGFSAIFMTGGFGYENRVPTAGNITSVEIRYMGRYGESSQIAQVEPYMEMDGYDPYNVRTHANYINSVTLTQPETIQMVLDFHTDVTAKKVGRNTMRYVPSAENQTISWTNTVMTYTMKNGARMTRYYNGVDVKSLLKLAALEINEDFIRQTHSAFLINPKDILSWIISNPYGTVNLNNPAVDSAELLNAMQSDLLSANINDLMSGDSKPIATITFQARYPREGSQRAASNGYFIVTEQTPKTLDYLQRKNLLTSFEVDWDKCTAVHAELSYLGVDRYRSSASAVVQVDPMRSAYAYDQLEVIRRDMKEYERYLAEYPNEYTEEYSDFYRGGYGWSKFSVGSGANLFEDKETMQALADAAIASSSIDNPMLIYASFYFEGSNNGTPILVDASKLPSSVLSKIEPEKPKG